MKIFKEKIVAILLFFIALSFVIAGCSHNSTIDQNTGNSDIDQGQETILVETVPMETAPPSLDQDQEAAEPDNDEAETEKITTEIKEGSTFSIRFLDVGQADAALVECDGRYMLIDGGNKEDSSLIYTVLKNAGVDYLDCVVATHAHEDHIGGLPGAYNYAKVENTLCPVDNYDSEAFRDFAKYAGEIDIPKAGDSFMLGSSVVTILGVNASQEVNDTSIVLKIEYGETSFLFTGDAERAAEQVLVDSGVDLSATVLKVGHHGSETSTGYVFLREVMPKYAVISVGEDNSYGHPTEDVLSRFRDADVTVYRTDMQGDIYCTSDGSSVSFSTEKNSDADTLKEVAKPDNKKPDLSQKPVNNQDKPTAPEENKEPVFDYVLNTNTKKFHYPHCSSTSQMKESNKDYFTGTRDEVISMGYEPCGRCNP